MTTKTPLPRVPWQRGFSFLPMSVQLTTIVVIGLLIISMLPCFVDRGSHRSFKAGFSKPSSSTKAVTRMHDYYTFGWLGDDQKQDRLRLVGLQLGVIAAGALAAKVAHKPEKADTSTKPITIGGTGRIRARAVVRRSA